MRVFKSKDEREYIKAFKRLSRVSPDQRLAWADSSLWAIQGVLDEYRRSGTPEALSEARTGVLGLLASVDSLLDNHR